MSDPVESILRSLTARTGIGFQDERVLRELLTEHLGGLERELNAERARAVEVDKCNVAAHKALRRRAAQAEAECEEYKHAARVADELRSHLEAVERVRNILRAKLETAKRLLGVAACPNCDGSGATIRGEHRTVSREMAMDAGDPNLEGAPLSEPEIEQCQWCDERANALAQLNAA